MQNKKLTWIHLSDLHMAVDETEDCKIVLSTLWADLKKIISVKNLVPDFIVFTGDVSNNGNKIEYDNSYDLFFYPLINVTGIDKKRLIIIPGNHDSNRLLSDKLKNPHPYIRDATDIRKLIKDKQHRQAVLSPFNNFRNFMDEYFPLHSSEDPAFYNVLKFEKESFTIAIIGLNSAWLCGRNYDSEGKVNDYGKIAISEFQLEEAWQLCDNAQIIIGAMHHPFDWLMKVDRDKIEPRMKKSCHIILHGHLHRPNVIIEYNLAGKVLTVPAGSVFKERDYPNSYNIVSLDLDTGQGRIYLRRYNRTRNEWQKDIISTGEENDGEFLFQLPSFYFATIIKPSSSGPVKDIRKYSITFTELCKKDMESLGITESDVINLVQKEFTGHTNYLKYDIEDFTLATRANLIVYINKNRDKIEFGRVIRCTKDKAKMKNWNIMLRHYKMATRLAWREEPSRLFSLQVNVGRIINEYYKPLIEQIINHFSKFEGIEVRPELRNLHKLYLDKKQKEKADKFITDETNIPASTDDIEKMGDEIAYNIGEAKASLEEVIRIVEAIDKGDIIKEKAHHGIVIELEKSLQHIHKIILRYPPLE